LPGRAALAIGPAALLAGLQSHAIADEAAWQSCLS